MIKTIINNKKANGYIISCVVILILSMIGLTMFEFSRNKMTTSSVRDGLESIATNICTDNADSIYPSQREGYFTSNVLINDRWQPKIDKSNLDKFMRETLATRKEGASYVKRNNEGGIDFKLSNVNIDIINPNLAPNNYEKNKLTFRVQITADLEINKMFNIVSNSKNIKLKVGSQVGYIPKF